MDPLHQIQHDLANRLRARSSLRQFLIQDLRPRSEGEATQIVDTINQALSTISNAGITSGIAILVPLAGFDVKRPNNPSPLGEITISVQVLENIMINMGGQGSGQSAEAVALEVLCAGHHLQLRDNCTMYAGSMKPLDVDGQTWSADIAYEVEFTLEGGFARPPECSIPQITQSGGNLSIATSTAGASIYVTTDGSFPWAGNPSAAPVSGPFAVPGSGTVIRAVAVKPGLEDSSVGYYLVP